MVRDKLLRQPNSWPILKVQRVSHVHFKLCTLLLPLGEAPSPTVAATLTQQIFSKATLSIILSDNLINLGADLALPGIISDLAR